MLARQLAVERDRVAEYQLRVQARDERDGERSQLVAMVGFDLDGPLAEAVESHQVNQRARPVGGALVAACCLRDVDRVVEVGVTDKYADDVA